MPRRQRGWAVNLMARYRRWRLKREITRRAQEIADHYMFAPSGEITGGAVVYDAFTPLDLYNPPNLCRQEARARWPWFEAEAYLPYPPDERLVILGHGPRTSYAFHVPSEPGPITFEALS